MPEKQIKLIINPAAGNGKGRKKWPHLHKMVNTTLQDFSYEFTQQSGDAVQIAKRALSEGIETIVAVGGDGTVSEVVNGFFENGKALNPKAKLGVIHLGTGGDFVKTVAAKTPHKTMLELIRAGSATPVDVGQITCHTPDGKKINRYFINAANAGFGGTLVQRVNKAGKRLGSFLTYLNGLMTTFFVYKNRPIHIKIDDFFRRELLALDIIVANGQYLGGGMWGAPNAKLNDGLFDVVLIGNILKREVVNNIAKLYNGRLINHRKVESLQGKKIILSAGEETLIDADGEVVGCLPAAFEIIPGALNIIGYKDNKD